MKRFVIIGLGNFGFYVAKSLFEDGHEVVAIDKDRLRVQTVDPHSTEAIVMDATDKEALKALGPEAADGVVVCTGDRISTSTLICLHLQELGVKKIVARAQDNDHEKILRRVGATEVVHPERDMAIRVSRSLSRPNILDFIPLGEKVDLVQIEPPAEFVGKTLKELGLRAKHNVNVIAIRQREPENFIAVPPADHSIKKSDTLILLGKSKDLLRMKALKQ